jgi:hypothetical protein
VGLDAPSQDLTARIAARRKALIREGVVDPMKPGEHLIAGRGGGQVDEAALARADMAARYRGRAGRGVEAGDEVVEMDFTDYTGTQPASREAADADEPFEVGEGEEPDEFDLGEDEPGERLTGEEFLDSLEPDEEPVLRRRRPEPVALRSHDADEILKGQEDLRERLDDIAAGMLALAEGFGEALANIAHPLVTVEASQFPVPTMQEIGRSADETPFEMPRIVCRDCGGEDDHNYCRVPRWLRWLGVR